MTIDHNLASVFIFILNVMGIVVFAVSGGLTAREKGFDLVGVLAVAVTTAIFGGTVRDVLLDHNPIFWIKEPLWLLLSLAGGTLSHFVYRLMRVATVEKLWLFLDAIGLALFAVSGSLAASHLTPHPSIVICMGVLTGCGGGVMRDVLCNVQPLLFRKEIYATAAFAASSLQVTLLHLGVGEISAAAAGFVFGFVLRLAAMRYGWSLRFLG